MTSDEWFLERDISTEAIACIAGSDIYMILCLGLGGHSDSLL